MIVKIAAVQTRTDLGVNARAVNLKRAKSYIDEAADQGANFVCFPESFPGPWKEDQIYETREAVAAMAAEKKVYVISGDLEKTENGEGYYNICWLFGPDGKVVGKYRRTTPEGPWIYKGGKNWDFNYRTANELPVFDTEYGKVGILICSEVYVPELARALALQGAEIIFYPTGVTRPEMWETWGTLVKARAFENLAVTVLTKNIVGTEEGFCIVASPEGMLLESHEEGVHVVSVDMDRLRWLRNTKDQYHEVLPYKVKPGLLTQWRRPAIFRDILK